MGLAERRAAAEFQTAVFPGLKQQIDGAAGFEVPMEIDWQSLAQPNDAHLYNEYWTKIYFEPLIGAFRRVCADDVGKEALKGGLKKIEVTNTGEKYDRRAFTFEDGVLKIDHKLTNVDHLDERTDKVVSLLEEGL
jgi:hypothetical protein